MNIQRPRVLPAAVPSAESLDLDSSRYQKLSQAICKAFGAAYGGTLEQQIAARRCARAIDLGARIEENEALMVQFESIDFTCRCSSGQHPSSCPIGWARVARAALQHRIDALRKAQEDHA